MSILKSNTLTAEYTLSQLNKLRGFFALSILLGHITQYENTIISILGRFMICAVAFFFFVSAFGMVISQKKEGKYLSVSFVINKPLYLLLIALFIYILDSISDTIITHFSSYSIGYATHFWSIYEFYIKTNWYIWALIGFYLLFFVAYKYFYRYRVLVIFLVTIVATLILFACDVQYKWYASSYAFPLGVMFGEYYDKISKFIVSKCGVILVIILAIFGFCSIPLENNLLISALFMRNSICIAAIVITVYMCSLEKITDNAVSVFLTKYSTAIYISQFFWVKVAYCLGLGFLWKFGLVVFMVFFESLIIIGPFIKLLKKGLRLIVSKLK